jgi:hypothetical protein
VSAYGRLARGGDKPPAELHPLGLEAPLAWLANQLEESDREQLEWLWDLAPRERSRLSRCVRALEKRYPRSDCVIDFRRRLNRQRARELGKTCLKLTAAAALVAAGAAGYDAWGFHRALRFEREGNSPVAVEKQWAQLAAWHPSFSFFWPQDAKVAARKRAEWEIKAQGVRVAVGTDAADLDVRLNELKEQAPDLAPAIRDVELARRQVLHDRRWKELQVAQVDAADRPDEALRDVRSFLKEFPETTHRGEIAKWTTELGARLRERRDAADRQTLLAVKQAGSLPGADVADLVRQLKAFLDDHTESPLRPEAVTLLAGYVRRLDEAQYEKARQASRQFPTNFALRIRKYQEYLDGHRSGGQFVSQAMEAIDTIERERDLYMYRLAYDHFTAHPADLSEVARRLRSYLEANPQGQRAGDAQEFLKWFEKVSAPGQYHVTLRRGEVESTVGKYLAGGGPDLSVELWVGGVKYGPSPIVRNTHRPIWDYTFSRPVSWKLGDSVIVRILDNDWSKTVVYTLSSPKDDPLAIKLLSGTMRPIKGGATHLVFASDFPMPKLRDPAAEAEGRQVAHAGGN